MISLIFDLQNEKEEQNIKAAFEELKTICTEMDIVNYKMITPFE